MSKGLKTLLIFLIIVVAGAIAYLLLGEGFSVPTPTLSSPLQTSTGQPVSGLQEQNVPDVDADQIGQEFLTQLLNIRSIKLRDDIFSSPAFISLTDFTIELNQLGNEGRDNPFAPFGVEGSPMTDPSLSIDSSIINSTDFQVNPASPQSTSSQSQDGVMFGPGSVEPTPSFNELNNGGVNNS